VLRRLHEANVALCLADWRDCPVTDEVTADFVYIRLHGSQELYASGYSDAELDMWAAKIAAWRRGGRDVYVYFDNDAKVHAPFDAMRLKERVEG
jgi:uncharacterized protein YecE (DUF72 family)